MGCKVWPSLLKLGWNYIYIEGWKEGKAKDVWVNVIIASSTIIYILQIKYVIHDVFI